MRSISSKQSFYTAPAPRRKPSSLPTETSQKSVSQDSCHLTNIPQPEISSSTLAAGLPGPVGACCALLGKELSPNDVDGWDQAEAYYDKVRSCTHDIENIAQNTPYSEKQVDTIKNHLFYNTHILDEGTARFDADPLIANAWSRLQIGTHSPKDLQLLEHELFEARFEALFDTDYRTAHAAADRSGRPSGLY